MNLGIWKGRGFKGKFEEYDETEINEIGETLGMVLNMETWGKREKKRSKGQFRKKPKDNCKEKRNKNPKLHLSPFSFSFNKEILVHRFLLIYLWFGP